MMRIFSVVVVSALVGILVGGAVAYVEVATDRDAIGMPGDKTKNVLALPTDANVPRVQVDEPEFNFGTMQQGTEKVAQLRIQERRRCAAHAACGEARPANVPSGK